MGRVLTIALIAGAALGLGLYMPTWLAAGFAGCVVTAAVARMNRHGAGRVLSGALVAGVAAAILAQVAQWVLAAAYPVLLHPWGAAATASAVTVWIGGLAAFDHRRRSAYKLDS